LLIVQNNNNNDNNNRYVLSEASFGRQKRFTAAKLNKD
jgi:hypothetical protein